MSEEKNANEVCDVCEACGSIVELGSVITEDDTVLLLPFSGADENSVKQLAQKYIDAAKARYETVVIKTDEKRDENNITLEVSFAFECTAEKLIFEMGLSSI